MWSCSRSFDTATKIERISTFAQAASLAEYGKTRRGRTRYSPPRGSGRRRPGDAGWLATTAGDHEACDTRPHASSHASRATRSVPQRPCVACAMRAPQRNPTRCMRAAAPAGDAGGDHEACDTGPSHAPEPKGHTWPHQNHWAAGDSPNRPPKRGPLKHREQDPRPALGQPQVCPRARFYFDIGQNKWTRQRP